MLPDCTVAIARFPRFTGGLCPGDQPDSKVDDWLSSTHLTLYGLA